MVNSIDAVIPIDTCGFTQMPADGQDYPVFTFIISFTTKAPAWRANSALINSVSSNRST